MAESKVAIARMIRDTGTGPHNRTPSIPDTCKFEHGRDCALLSAKDEKLAG